MPKNTNENIWSVIRQDDNGNHYVVKRNLSYTQAHKVVKEYEEKGHKQTFWVTKTDKSAYDKI